MIHLNVHLALGRLTAALDLLAAAAERQSALDAERQTLGEERHIMAADRARLADELDAALAQAGALDAASRVVEGRLAGLGSTLRALAEGRD